MNEELRQTEVTEEVEVAARRLIRRTSSFSYPPDSYAILGTLRSTVTNLAQVALQLACWHDEAVKGVEYVGENDNGDGRGTIVAAQKLRQATVALEKASEKLAAAHSASSVVRWNPQPGL